MKPRFKRSGSGIYVGTQIISTRCKCDCGKAATVLASFRIIRPPSSEIDSAKRGEQGALLLCYDCAMQMWLQEIDHKLRRSCLEDTDYMLIEHALELASTTAVDTSNNRVSTYNNRWTEIIKWISQRPDGVTIAEVADKFGFKTDSITARLSQLKRSGILESERRGGCKGGRIHYWLKEKA